MTLPGDTGRADVPLRPEEMDAAAHFVRNQGYSPERFGPEPARHSNYMAWPVPADQIKPEPVPVVSPEPGGGYEPAVESTLGASVGLLVEPPEGPTAEPTAEPAVEPAVEREAPRPGLAAAPDAQAKPHTIVWKAFPRPRS